MARRAFDSFHYKPDSARAARIGNMGVAESNKPATDNEWEKPRTVEKRQFRTGLTTELKGKSCNVVLIAFYRALPHRMMLVQEHVPGKLQDLVGAVPIFFQDFLRQLWIHPPSVKCL
jgi:hypothetical protein